MSNAVSPHVGLMTLTASKGSSEEKNSLGLIFPRSRSQDKDLRAWLVIPGNSSGGKGSSSEGKQTNPEGVDEYFQLQLSPTGTSGTPCGTDSEPATVAHYGGGLQPGGSAPWPSQPALRAS